MKKMEPFFGGLILIFIFFFIEIETAGIRKQIKTECPDTADKLDDMVRREDHETTPVIGTPARPKKLRGPGGPLYSNFLSEPDQPDPTGKKAHKLFLNHYKEKGIPNAPRVTLDLYDARYASGSYYLPERKCNARNKNRIYEEARTTAYAPFVEEHHQRMYQQHQALQNHSRASVSSSGLAAYNRYRNSYNIRDQSDQSKSASSSTHSYTSPPMTPSEDLTAQFNIQAPQHLNLEQDLWQNNPTAAALIDNYNIHLRRKYWKNSTNSGSS